MFTRLATLLRSAKLYEINYKEILYMKKLKEELFINAEEVYGKELIDKLRQKIYDIG